MKTLPFVIGLLISFSCANDSKKDVLRPADERLAIYNSVLDDLVKNHFYNLYLGEDFEELERKFNRLRGDPEYRIGLENLRSLVDSDTSIQSAICLRHELSFIKFTQLGNEGDLRDSASFIASLSNHLGDSLTNSRGVYDSLNSPQKQFLHGDFQPSSFKVNATDCSIGHISFSNIFLDKPRVRGLLYYEFHCGEKCGKGEVLLIEKKNGQWVIEKNIRLWIS